MLLPNVLLALVWLALSGVLTWQNFVLGFALGYVILWLNQRTHGRRGYVQKTITILRFTAFYLWELVLANLRAAVSVLRPLDRLKPAIIGVPIRVRSDVEITLLANLITLTPGTLTLDVSSDRKTLYIHTVEMEDPESFRQMIWALEDRVEEVLS